MASHLASRSCEHVGGGEGVEAEQLPWLYFLIVARVHGFGCLCVGLKLCLCPIRCTMNCLRIQATHSVTATAQASTSSITSSLQVTNSLDHFLIAARPALEDSVVRVVLGDDPQNVELQQQQGAYALPLGHNSAVCSLFTMLTPREEPKDDCTCFNGQHSSNPCHEWCTAETQASTALHSASTDGLR